MTQKENFMRHVEPVPFAGCWLWTGATLEAGYGIFGAGSTRTAHRVSYEMFKGEIPEDKMVLHTCDVSCCVNPNHLYLGTHARNMKDRSERGRTAKGERHGMYGKASRGNARLTEDDVRAIRASSKTRTSLAKEYGVTIAAISAIVHRKLWKHI